MVCVVNNRSLKRSLSMSFKQLIAKFTGKPKQPSTHKVQVDINYVQSHADANSFFGQSMDTSAESSDSIKDRKTNEL